MDLILQTKSNLRMTAPYHFQKHLYKCIITTFLFLSNSYQATEPMPMEKWASFVMQIENKHIHLHYSSTISLGFTGTEPNWFCSIHEMCDGFSLAQAHFSRTFAAC